MSNIARVLDCDGTITDIAEGTLLERLMMDFYREQPLPKRINLFFRSLAIRGYGIFAKALGKFSGEQEITGETNSLKLFDLLMLRKAQIPMSFLDDRAKEYAKLIKPEHIAAIKNCKDDVYIVSAEPKQLLEAILIHAGLYQHIVGVYGTKFEIVNGVIEKFDRSELIAGVPGKHIGMADIISNGYSRVYAIGDSAADKGLFKTYKRKILPYTFYNAPEDLVNFVLDNNGKVIDSLEEFFKDN